MSKEKFLAVAFTDLNGNDKYNPGKDTLIAAVADTNNDNTVSVGDTIQWGTYPAIPDGTASGTGGIFLNPDSTITDVVVANDSLVFVDSAGGSVEWAASPNVVEEFATIGFTGLESHLVDSINLTTADDLIFADPDVFGPGHPNMLVDVTTHQLGDQAFLDVWIA